MPSKRTTFLLVLLPGILLGSTLISTRFSLGQFSPLTLVSLRLAVASLAFLIAFPLLRGLKIPKDRSLWVRSAIYGLIGTALTMTGFTFSLKYQSSGVTSLLASLSPIVTALMAHYFLHDEPLNRYRVLGALIAFSGAGLLLLRGESGLAELARADWRGYAWALLGMFSNSAGMIYARRYLHSADSFTSTSIRIMTGTLVIAIINGLVYGYDLSQVQWSGILALAYAGIVGTFLAFLFYMMSIQRLGATVASQTEFIVPLIATGLGVAVLGEHVTATMLVGMVFIFAGLAVFDRGRSRSTAVQSNTIHSPREV